jgi:hypothetical protein
MQTHHVTFLYDGIYAADGEGDPLEGVAAYRQWTWEFESANDLPVGVLGWRVTESSLAGKRVHVQFITVDEISREDLCEIIQTRLYDEEGLSGEYHMGHVVPYEVSRQEMVVRTRTVYAENDEDAVRRASAGGTVLSCERRQAHLSAST